MKLVIKTVISIILFFLGGIIYLGYRSKTLLMFKWTDYLNINNTINSWRSFAIKHPLPDWILYSLPDGLWLLSYMILIDTIWGNDSKGLGFWLYILPIIGIVSELIQIPFPIIGTFDFVDLACYISAVIIYKLYKIIIL